jgi:two-component system OmpR family response regulator
MPATATATVKGEDVYATTEKGNRELKAAGTSLSLAELEVLVLVDGFSSVSEIAARAPGIPRNEVIAAVGKLLAGRMVVSTAEPESDVMGSGFSTIAVPAGFYSGLSLSASPEAEGGAAILKKKGYFVRIARRPAERREVKDSWQPTVLVVDDDADLQKLVRTYLSLEGFHMRIALKASDIVIALRQQPPPDLVLLDVQLPDANGFDLLAKMRQHPVLKSMPVIMFTAEATREAVLRGLQGGADGYITKPFEPDQLISAVKSVLGVGAPPPDAKKKKKK